MDPILEQLQPIFQDVLDQPDLVITRQSDASSVEDWDSLAHVNIVTAVELKNVGDMVDLVNLKLKSK